MPYLQLKTCAERRKQGKRMQALNKTSFPHNRVHLIRIHFFESRITAWLHNVWTVAEIRLHQMI